MKQAAERHILRRESAGTFEEGNRGKNEDEGGRVSRARVKVVQTRLSRLIAADKPYLINIFATPRRLLKNLTCHTVDQVV